MLQDYRMHHTELLNNVAVKSEIFMHYLRNKGGVDIAIEFTVEQRVVYAL